MTKKEEYDGLLVTTKGSRRSIRYNIEKALKQDNPRNVFLNGQLFIEMSCDSLIKVYFTNNDPLRMGILSEFLKSRHFDYFMKIKLIKILKYEDSSPSFKPQTIASNQLIKSLISIGEIRNVFQHNLDIHEAMKSVRKISGSKFSFLDKKLKNYHQVDDLVNDFKKEVITVNKKIVELIFSIIDGNNSL